MASEYCKPINLSYAYQQQKIENAKILQKKTKKTPKNHQNFQNPMHKTKLKLQNQKETMVLS